MLDYIISLLSKPFILLSTGKLYVILVLINHKCVSIYGYCIFTSNHVIYLLYWSPNKD